MDKNVSSTITLKKSFFSENEKVFLENGRISVSVFIYDTGVHALRIRNLRGEIIVLPYQGQQIWDCVFDKKRLTMKSMFEKPVDTLDYLKTYGGFLLHCGVSAMGVPSKEDDHPLHGELPNAPYQKAYLETGCDEKGRFIGIGGEYEYTVAFNHHYIAHPYIKLYEDAAVMSVSIAIENLKKTPMELMYMMHINFRPVDNSSLLYTAKSDSENIKVHVNIPSHMELSDENEKFTDFLYELEQNPAIHNNLNSDLMFDPEIVFTVKYLTDVNGYAYSMQLHPDGYASYVCHSPKELPVGIRWISRTPDQDALGLVLPATAEHKGYTEEKRKNNIIKLKGREKVIFNTKAGLLNPDEAKKVANKIKGILQANS